MIAAAAPKPQTTESVHEPQKSEWKYKEKAEKFRKRHPGVRYTMAFNPVVDLLIGNEAAGLPLRLLLLVWRLSWGNLNDTPVDQMPKVYPKLMTPSREMSTKPASPRG